MVDFRREGEHGRLEGVFGWEGYDEFEVAALMRVFCVNLVEVVERKGGGGWWKRASIYNVGRLFRAVDQHFPFVD